ncbi:MAG: YggT family protein [Methylococcaceae bacterium]|nr:YggT family protein [Methylococcaceae bacterium]
MGSTYVSEPVIFLIDTLCSLYILAIILRFLLQWSGADSYNPIAQLLIKITHPPLKFLRRYIPSLRKIDTSALVLALGLQMLADFAILFLKGVTVGIAALCVISFTQLLSLVINIFIFSIFVSALLSWFNPGAFHAAAGLLQRLSEPLLGICRQMLPEVGGVDFSSLLALILLQLAKMLLLPPLHELASLIG